MSEANTVAYTSPNKTHPSDIKKVVSHSPMVAFGLIENFFIRNPTMEVVSLIGEWEGNRFCIELEYMI